VVWRATARRPQPVRGSRPLAARPRPRRPAARPSIPATPPAPAHLLPHPAGCTLQSAWPAASQRRTRPSPPDGRPSRNRLPSTNCCTPQLDFGANPIERQLVLSAQFLQKELPVRLAHRCAPLRARERASRPAVARGIREPLPASPAARGREVRSGGRAPAPAGAARGLAARPCQKVGARRFSTDRAGPGGRILSASCKLEWWIRPNETKL
jgi:hypothetical protein